MCLSCSWTYLSDRIILCVCPKVVLCDWQNVILLELSLHVAAGHTDINFGHVVLAIAISSYSPYAAFSYKVMWVILHFTTLKICRHKPSVSQTSRSVAAKYWSTALSCRLPLRGSLLRHPVGGTCQSKRACSWLFIRSAKSGDQGVQIRFEDQTRCGCLL